MMKTTLLFTLMLIGLTAISQPCKLVQDEMDPFDKIVRKKTKGKFLTRNMNTNAIRIAAFQRGKTKGFEAKIFQGDVFTIEAGDRFRIMLMNDSIVTLSAIKTQVASPTQKGTWISYVEYGVNKQQFEMLKDQGIKLVRISTSSGYYQEEVPPQLWMLIPNLLGCLDWE